MKKIAWFLCFVALLFCFTACDDKKVDLNEYDISVELFSDMTYSGQMRFSYVNNKSEKVNELKFQLYPNAFRENAKISPVTSEQEEVAYGKQKSYGNITISQVKQGGSNAVFSICGVDENILMVKLNEPITKGDSAEIYMDFSGVLPRVCHRFGYFENTVNFTGFYPILCAEYKGEVYESVYYSSGDPFYSDSANYKVNLKVPGEYSVASSMSPTKTIINEVKTEYDYERKNVRDIAFIMSKDFQILKKQSGNVCVSYYYFQDNQPEKSLETAVNSLAFYSDNFSAYPYAEYVLCETDFLYGGMEYPCLTFIDKSLIGFSRDYCIAHETAHQWWYGIVGVNQAEEGFLDEGLTEYSSSLYMATDKNYQVSVDDLIQSTKKAYKEIRFSLAGAGTQHTPIMIRNLGEFASDLDYVSTAYYRSQIMYYELNRYLGEKKFKKFLKAIIGTYAHKNVTYENIRQIAENIKGGAGEILDGYVWGKTCIE